MNVVTKLSKKLNNKVIKAGSWYTITEFFLKGVAFLTIPIFTRILSPAEYGMVSLYTTWVAMFTIFLGLNLNTSITRGKFDFKENFNEFVSNTMLLSFIIFLIYLIIFFIFDNFFMEITGLTKGLFYFMVIHAYFNFVKTSIITKFRVEYRYKFISIISIAITLLGVALSVYLILYVFQENGHLGKIIGEAFFIIVMGLFFLWFMLRLGKVFSPNLQQWKYSLTLSVPLVLHSVSNVANSQFDRIIINKYVGEVATGLYSFAYSLGMIVFVLIHALDQAWSPWVYEKMDKNDYDTIKEKGVIYRNVVTIAYAGMLFLSPEIIKIMAAPSYWEALDVIPWIFMAYYFTFLYTLEVKTEFYYRKTGLISVGTFLAALANIALNFIFVPIYGYVAAAVTTTVSYILLFIFHFIIVTKVIKHNVYGLKFHLISIFYVSIITIFFMVFQDSLLIRMLGVIILVLIFLKSIMKKD